jgi:FAD/FMN-containing dehydrogenase
MTTGLFGDLGVAAKSATVIGERLPADGWASLGAGPVRDRLSVGIKQTFDPAGVFNPGILG